MHTHTACTPTLHAHPHRMHLRLLLALQEIRAARDEAVRSARKEAQRQEERLASQLGLTQQLQREAHSRMSR